MTPDSIDAKVVAVKSRAIRSMLDGRCWGFPKTGCEATGTAPDEELVHPIREALDRWDEVAP